MKKEKIEEIINKIEDEEQKKRLLVLYNGYVAAQKKYIAGATERKRLDIESAESALNSMIDSLSGGGAMVLDMYAGYGHIMTIFVTFIQSQWGVLPRGMLNALGYTPAMLKKIPTMFNRNGQEKLFRYLSKSGKEKCRLVIPGILNPGQGGIPTIVGISCRLSP